MHNRRVDIVILNPVWDEKSPILSPGLALNPLSAPAAASLPVPDEATRSVINLTVHVLPAPQDLPKLAESELFDLILLDRELHGSAVPANDCLNPFQRRWPEASVVLLTAEASV